MLKLLHLIILGPPGSGKGTISSRIIKEFKVSYLACGDLLRGHVHKKTAEGLDVKEFLDRGQLVPDHLVTKLMLKELTSLSATSWLLDGFPRTIQQAEALSKNVMISSVINLNVPDEVILDRLKGRWIHLPSGRIYNTEFKPPKKMGIDDVTGEPLIQREDDKPEKFKIRLIDYNNLTRPVLDYYGKRNLLKEFSGSYTDEIWPQVLSYLKKLSSSVS